MSYIFTFYTYLKFLFDLLSYIIQMIKYYLFQSISIIKLNNNYSTLLNGLDVSVR